MVSDDACSTFVELLKRLLDIVSDIERNRQRTGHGEEIKQPKIKVGSLSKANFEKLKKSGEKFKYITVPAEKREELEEAVKKLGGSYFDAHIGDSKSSVIAVPESQLELLNTALKHIVAKEVAENSERLLVKDGQELIDENDMHLVSDIMSRYDIPVISFRTDDNKYMNIVPKEYEGQYQTAMNEAREIKKQIDNIDVVRYDQTSPLDRLSEFAEVITADEAMELSAFARAENLDIKFMEQQDGVAVFYKSDIAEKVNKARQEYAESLSESEDYLVDIMDNVITLDKSALMINEMCNSDSFFMKVPGTMGQDYIRIDKSEAEHINGGKTIKTELDLERKYPIYDRTGKPKREVSGKALAENFNSRNRHANKETAQYNFDTDGKELGRIDLFCQKKNELISIKIEDVSKVISALKERGLGNRAIRNLLDDINSKLSDKEKAVFNYTAEKSEIVYADIPNIGEYLAQTQLSKEVISKADCMDEYPIGKKGPVCCVHDKNSHKYAVIPVAPISTIKAELTERGYSEDASSALAEKIADTYRIDDDVLKPAKTVEAVRLTEFSDTNAELKKVGYYKNEEYAVIVKEDSEDYHYMQLDKGIEYSELEKALRDEFGIVDDITLAAVIKQMAFEEVVADLPKKETKEAEIYRITGNIIEVTAKSTGETAALSINNIDTEKLIEIGLTQKAAEDIKKSFEKSITEAEHPEKQNLRELLKHGAEEFAKGAKTVGGAVKDKITTIGKGQGR